MKKIMNKALVSPTRTPLWKVKLHTVLTQVVENSDKLYIDI